MMRLLFGRLQQILIGKTCRKFYQSVKLAANSAALVCQAGYKFSNLQVDILMILQ